MAGARLFVLPSPWALFDTEAEQAGYGRLPLDLEAPAEVPAGRPVYLAIPVGAEVRVSGNKMAAHRLGKSYKWRDEEYALYLLSVGVRPNETSLAIDVDGVRVGVVSIKGYVARPAFSAGTENDKNPQLRAELLDGFLLSIVNLIQMTSDPQYEKFQIVWDRLQTAWSDAEAESTIPPMALIVRHADKFASLVRDLVRKPRHLLRRQRELTSVDRVQQLDVSCVRWLSRQPGTTVYERAGPRQKIMAVQRYESVDTLENRVLRDFVIRTSREASRYTKMYERLNKTGRWNLVRRYGRRCHHAVSELGELNVSRLTPPVVPNFVLLQDVRYRFLWRAYLELIRRQDEEDECWRWQHRLWLDYCRLVIHLSLRQADSFEPIAEEPLRINQEQKRGVWSSLQSQSGTWVYKDEDGEEFVVSFVWDVDRDHPKTGAWVSALGCSSYLHIARLSDNEEGFILLWGYHGFQETSENLDALGNSCQRAIDAIRNLRRINYDERLRIDGVIFVSNPYGDTIKKPFSPEKPLESFRKFGRVSAVRMGVSRSDIISISKRFSSLLPVLIRNQFGGDGGDG